jgi:CRISPR-associated protein (TIGR03985 family)
MAAWLYPPTPQVLHWLSGGALGARLRRAIRCWVWLDRLYGESAGQLPQPFRYSDLRDRNFPPSHPTADAAPVADMQRQCQGSPCLCQRSAQDLLFRQHPSLATPDWLAAMAHLSGLKAGALEAELNHCPFATVHRALRDDLAWLTQTGWLGSAGRGQWLQLPPSQWPPPIGSGPANLGSPSPVVALSPVEQHNLWQLLDSIAFLQPQLAVVVDTLWQQLTAQPLVHPLGDRPRRLFVHLDYVPSAAAQEQTDQHQEDIEQLWHRPDGGVVQFWYLSSRRQQRLWVTAYPVCLHYARRAKYLTVYGTTPQGTLDWWNYRLDRIESSGLKTLPWGDPAVPEGLKRLRQTGKLPSPETVEQQLEEAWGFNFYLPKALLILRFAPQFARWYVDDTDRHPTFAPIAYDDLPQLITKHAPAADQPALLALVARRAKTDRYYQGWIRLGDTNVTMRLRDWRPNGEVIAPLITRSQMAAEAQQEMEWYQD